VTEELKSKEVPPPRHAMTGAPAPYRSLLRPDPRSRGSAAGFVAAVVLHAGVVGAAFFLPALFDKPHPVRKPVIARLVALGKPRDQALLPRREAPPPPAVAPPAAASRPESPATEATKKTMPSPKPSPAPPRAPSRAELMQQALAGVQKKRGPGPTQEKPDPDREGSPTGSAEGTAATAEEGDKYFTEVHDAIQANYVVPSVISERERMYLNATVMVFIAPDGSIVKNTITTPSGNSFFDQALVLAIEKTKLPAPPLELRKIVRDGVALNFRP
jgi:colicin import membrane protein